MWSLPLLTVLDNSPSLPPPRNRQLLKPLGVFFFLLFCRYWIWHPLPLIKQSVLVFPDLSWRCRLYCHCCCSNQRHCTFWTKSMLHWICHTHKILVRCCAPTLPTPRLVLMNYLPRDKISRRCQHIVVTLVRNLLARFFFGGGRVSPFFPTN